MADENQEDVFQLTRLPHALIVLILSLLDLPEAILMMSVCSMLNNFLSRDASSIQAYNRRDRSQTWIFSRCHFDGFPPLGVIYGSRLLDGRELYFPLDREFDFCVNSVDLLGASRNNFLFLLRPLLNLYVVNPFSGNESLVPLPTEMFPHDSFEGEWRIRISSEEDRFMIVYVKVVDGEEPIYRSYESQDEAWIVLEVLVGIYQLEEGADASRNITIRNEDSNLLTTIFFTNGLHNPSYMTTHLVYELTGEDLAQFYVEDSIRWEFFGIWAVRFDFDITHDEHDYFPWGLCDVFIFRRRDDGSAYDQYGAQMSQVLVDMMPEQIVFHGVSTMESEGVIHLAIRAGEFDQYPRPGPRRTYVYHFDTRNGRWSFEHVFQEINELGVHALPIFTNRLFLDPILNED